MIYSLTRSGDWIGIDGGSSATLSLLGCFYESLLNSSEYTSKTFEDEGTEEARNENTRINLNHVQSMFDPVLS